MADDHHERFSKYCRAILNESSEYAGRWLRDNLLLPIIFALVTVVAAYFLLKTTPDWRALEIILWTYGIAILFGVSVVFIRSPWRIDQKLRFEIEGLKDYKKRIEESRVRIELCIPEAPAYKVRCVHFYPNGEQETATALRVKFVNKVSMLPGKTAYAVLARMTYTDEGGGKFSQFGRWADSTQPERLHPLDSSNVLLPMDFLPGAEHELDLAAKFPQDFSCYAVNNDSFPDIRRENQKLHGPKVHVSVELTSEQVHKKFEFKFKNLGPNASFSVE